MVGITRNMRSDRKKCVQIFRRMTKFCNIFRILRSPQNTTNDRTELAFAWIDSAESQLSDGAKTSSVR